MIETQPPRRVLNRVLVVDDDPGLRDLLRVLLEEAGYEVTMAATGHEATRLLAADDIPVAVVDWRLPDVQGQELLARIRAASGSTRVVIHTGYGSYESARDALNLGAYAYVEKVHDGEELLARVAAAHEDRFLDQLRELEQRHRLHITSASEPLLVHRGHTVLHASVGAAALFGAGSASLLVGPSSTVTIPEAIVTDAPELDPDHLPEDPLIERRPRGEVRIHGLDGHLRLVRISSAPCVWAGGAATLTTLQDRTEHEATTRRLAAADEGFRALLESPTVMFWLTTPGRSELLCQSPGPAQVTGTVGAALRWDPAAWLELVHEDDRVAVDRALDARLDPDGGPRRIEYRIRRPDGRIVWVWQRSATVFDEHGHPIARSSVASDVTDGAARSSVDDLETQWRAALDGAPAGIVLLEEEGRIRFATRSIDGCHAGELRGRRFESLLDDRSGAALGAALAEVRARRQPAMLEVASRSGGRLMVRLSMVEPHDDQHLVLATYVDPNQKRDPRPPVDGAALAAQRMQAIGLLAGGVAHDFNNLLTVVLGNAELLDRLVRTLPGPERSEAIGAITDIRDASQRASMLTRQLLTLSRRRLGRGDHADPAEIVRGMVPFLERLLGPETALEVELTSDRILATIDRNEVEQILQCLVTNAGEAIRGPGTVIVEVAPAHVDAERLESVVRGRPGPHVRLSVSDTGRGIDPSLRSRVFDPFFTTKSVGKGTGLGLAIVHGILSRLAGHLTVESRPGAGTTVSAYLPVAPEGVGASPRPRETVLIIEYDRHLLDLMREALRGAGYAVLHASGAEEALDRLRDVDGLDLVVCDIVLPEMDGVVLAEAVRERHPEVPVLFVTATTADVLTGRGIDPESLELLARPFSPRQLLSRVRTVIDGRLST